MDSFLGVVTAQVRHDCYGAFRGCWMNLVLLDVALQLRLEPRLWGGDFSTEMDVTALVMGQL